MVINHLDETSDNRVTAISYVYCNHKEKSRQGPVEILRGLMKQLIGGQPGASKSIQAFYETFQNQKRSPTVAELESLLVEESSRFNRVFLVLDAVDECDDATWAALLPVLQNLPEQFRVMVTSRPYDTFKDDFTGWLCQDILASEEDVQNFIRSRVTEDRRLKTVLKNSSELTQRCIDTIVSKAKGMYVLFPHIVQLK